MSPLIHRPHGDHTPNEFATAWTFTTNQHSHSRWTSYRDPSSASLLYMLMSLDGEELSRPVDGTITQQPDPPCLQVDLCCELVGCRVDPSYDLGGPVGQQPQPMDGGTTYYFVIHGIKSALAQARKGVSWRIGCRRGSCPFYHVELTIATIILWFR